MICSIVLSATDLAHGLQVHANLLLIVMHCCGAATESVCTKIVLCCVPFRAVCFGEIEGCTMKKHLPICSYKGYTVGVA